MIDLDLAGNACVAGDLSVASFSPGGEKRWTFGPDDPEAWVDSIGGMTLDTSGRVYVTGASFLAEETEETHGHFVAAKLPAR